MLNDKVYCTWSEDWIKKSSSKASLPPTVTSYISCWEEVVHLSQVSLIESFIVLIKNNGKHFWWRVHCTPTCVRREGTKTSGAWWSQCLRLTTWCVIRYRKFVAWWESWVFGASALAGKKLLVCKHSKFKFDTVNGIPD